MTNGLIRTDMEVVEATQSYEILQITADVTEFGADNIRIRQSQNEIEIVCQTDGGRIIETVHTPKQFDNLAEGEIKNGILVVTQRIYPHDRARWDIYVSDRNRDTSSTDWSEFRDRAN